MTNLTATVLSHALCRDADPELWFPVADPRSNLYVEQARRPLDICAACPIVAQCLADVMATERGQRYRFGIRGGMTAEARAELAGSDRETRRAGIPAPAPIVVRGPAAPGCDRPPRTDPTPGQGTALLAAHRNSRQVPGYISGSITQSLIRDGLAERRPHGSRAGHGRRCTVLTEHGVMLAGVLARAEAAEAAEMDATVPA